MSWSRREFANFEAPSFIDWLEKPKWTAKEAAILLTGGNPSEIDWNKHVDGSQGETSLTKLAYLQLWPFEVINGGNSPLTFIKTALERGMEIHPSLKQFLEESGALPEISTGSPIHNYYKFWANMDVWTADQSLKLLAGIDTDEQLPFLTAKFYRERHFLLCDLSRLLVSSVEAGYFSGASVDYLDDYRFKPLDIMNWAHKKGYSFPSILHSMLMETDARFSDKVITVAPAQNIRESQLHKARCRALAQRLWDIDPTITIAAMVAHDDITQYGCENTIYNEKVMRGWIRDLHPNPQSGRPRKLPA